MKRIYLALIALLFVSLSAQAEMVTLTWQWPTTYCNAEPLALTDIQSAEIYISEAPIPRVPSSCDTGDVDVPPSGAIIATVSTPNTTVDIDLPCGKTYYFVMRNQANGQWSNFSMEAMRDLSDCGRPNIPIIISLS